MGTRLVTAHMHRHGQQCCLHHCSHLDACQQHPATLQATHLYIHAMMCVHAMMYIHAMMCPIKYHYTQHPGSMYARHAYISATMYVVEYHHSLHSGLHMSNTYACLCSDTKLRLPLHPELSATCLCVSVVMYIFDFHATLHSGLHVSNTFVSVQ